MLAMLARTLDLKKLRAFYLVAKHGSLRNAAAQMLLSISAVSLQIKQLEEELGVKLFGRVGRKLILLPTGHTFLQHVKTVFDAVDTAVASVSTVAVPKKRIAIAVGTDLTRFFAPAIGRFLRTHPNVEIALQLKHSPESLARILEDQLDMAIGYFSKVPKDLEKRTFMKSGFSMSFATNHPLAKIRNPSIEDIAPYPVISLRKETDIGRRILRAFNDRGLEPVNFLEVGNCQSSQDLAAQDIGVAFAHTTCLSGYKASEMRNIDATRILGQVDVAVVMKKSRPLSALQQALLDEMASVSTDVLRPTGSD
jgi:DNA-binding transcriptional LysR family regulator